MNSLREQVRSARGEGSTRCVLDNTTIPKNWASFLHNSDNKKRTVFLSITKIANINAPNKEIYTTYLNSVLSTSSVRIESSNQINPCNHEEADTRMLLHAAHAAHVARYGHSKVIMQTVDTGVVHSFSNFPNAQFTAVGVMVVEFGVCKHYRVIATCTLNLSENWS